MLHDNLFVVPILSREGKYIHNKDRGVCVGGGGQGIKDRGVGGHLASPCAFNRGLIYNSHSLGGSPWPVSHCPLAPPSPPSSSNTSTHSCARPLARASSAPPGELCLMLAPYGLVPRVVVIDMVVKGW